MFCSKLNLNKICCPELEKVLAEGERNGLSELCKSGDVIWE